MYNNLSETTKDQALAELTLFLIDNKEEVIRALKNVHDLALYMTTEPLHPEDRTDLFFTKELKEHIQNIPQ
jgi:dsDNA-binding SOS-regulon protein